MQELNIKWDTGEMTIILDRFFPTTIARYKKLLDIIKLDWRNRDELVEILKSYLQKKLDEPKIFHTKRNIESFKRCLKIIEEKYE